MFSNNTHNIWLRYLIALCLLGLGFISNAQNIIGHVYSLDSTGNRKAIAGANIHLSGTGNRTTSDINGKFSIAKESQDSSYVVAEFKDFFTDSILIAGNVAPKGLEIQLRKVVRLEEVFVAARQYGTTILRNAVLKTEQISDAGLMKMACCNLAESFENSATITVGFTDAISGAKQIQLLGLSGNYTQLLAENIPSHRGLASTFGWSYVPGSWLESLQISKGASSVVNGYESVSGQINLEFKKPNNGDPLFINLYSDQFGCYEGNMTASTQVAKNLWSGLLVSGTVDNNVHDFNGDGFLDMPKRQYFNAFNRWFYLKPNGIQSRTGIRFLYEDRTGGHDSQHSNSGNALSHYVTNIRNRNFAVENKTGIPIGDKDRQSVGIITSITHHGLNAAFGQKFYDGYQTTFYSNVLFTSHLGNATSNKYTLGGSFAYDFLETQYQDATPFILTPLTALKRKEIVPGLFGEYTYSGQKKFTLVIGARADYNSKYGWLFTPRANLKYNISDDIIIRGSVGKGYRAPNVIAENIGILASSRKLYLDGFSDLGIERALNYGGNLTFYIPIWEERKMTFSLDYFHTGFQNQAIVDIERNGNKVFFYNLNGKSYADALQVDLSVTPFNGLDIFAAFRYNNTKITYSDGDQHFLVDKPLTSCYRGLINLSYATKFKKWVFDFTSQVNGPTRIPCLNGYNSELKESPFFPIYFAQVTKNTKRFDIYVGAENIFDYKQNNPIIGANNPFDQGFESSFVWGPILGRKIYAGIRLRIGEIR